MTDNDEKLDWDCYPKHLRPSEPPVESKVGVEVIEEFPGVKPPYTGDLLNLPPLEIKAECSRCLDKEGPFAMAIVGDEEKLLCESCVEAQGGDGFEYVDKLMEDEDEQADD